MNKSLIRLTASAGVIVLLGLIVALAASQPAPATAQLKGPEVTVYNSNIALVTEAREFNLKAGVNSVNVTDVPSGIVPETMHFRSLTDPNASVLEQNYEYDVVGSQKLLEKYIDKPIEVVTQDGAVYSGTLLSGAHDVILQNDKGGVEVIQFDQIKHYSFPALPEGLITKPTLVWSVDATKGGKHNTELSYLTNGLNWLANYVLVLAQDGKSLDLDGWITLDNRSGATYQDAKLKLVAGDINRAPTPEAVYTDVRASRC